MWSFFNRDPSKDFGYDIGEPVTGAEDGMFFRLHKGKKRGTQDEVSVFVLDTRTAGSDTQLELAKTAIKRLKTLRHPNVLTYVDSLETDKCVYLVTEPVEPLQTHLNHFTADDEKSKQQKELFIAWGLFQVTRALSFLNNDGNIQHNSVCISSIFVNAAGEWKLGGVEYTTTANPSNPPPVKILPSLEKYDPPEKFDQSKLRSATKWSTDMWGLGCLIWEVFNGFFSKPAQLKTLGSIPKVLCPVYCELVGANPAARPNPNEVIQKCRRPGGYFHNDLVDCLLFLEEIQIKEPNEKTKFFSTLSNHLDGFPENLSKHKILPQLIHAFEFGNAGSAVLTPMLKLGNLLSEEEYQKRIVPCVVKLFASPDRATRARLLVQLEHFAKHLPPATVNDQIFPQIANGFIDANPTIREQTVKSILYLAPKLNYNNLNGEVLKHFARLQAKDDQGGIRTNTTVCLGKIASFLHPQTRQKILISAFTRAMGDSFPPARMAGIMALAATQGYYQLSEAAQRILPALCALSVDPEKEVRDQAFKVIKGYLAKLEKVSEDPSLKESMEAHVNASSSPSASEMASTWAGWAVSAVTSKFYKSQPSKAAPTAASSVPASSADVPQPKESSQSSAAAPAAVAAAAGTSGTKAAALSSGGTNDDDSDYEGNWDSSSWGTMNGSSNTASVTQKTNDGWEVDEWAPLEEAKPVAAATRNTDQESDFTPALSNEKGLKSISSYQWENTSQVQTGASDWNSWNDGDGWDSTQGSGDLSKEEARKRREEKKQQRQKELEAKRTARQAGPLKLGARKLAND